MSYVLIPADNPRELKQKRDARRAARRAEFVETYTVQPACAHEYTHDHVVDGSLACLFCGAPLDNAAAV